MTLRESDLNQFYGTEKWYSTDCFELRPIQTAYSMLPNMAVRFG